MASPQLHHLSVNGPPATGGSARRIAFWDWEGPVDGSCQHVVVCVHGLARQGRDFDVLARALIPHARVLSVDVAGRGHSDWLDDPSGYQVPTYAADLAQLMGHVRQQAPHAVIDWVGTSMGGLIGIAIAAQPALAPRRLVLNDVGPAIRWEALQRIGGYIGEDPSFSSEQEAFDYLARLSVGFGPHTTEQWAALSRPMLRQREGRWWLHYDPAISAPFRALAALGDESTARQAVQAGEEVLWNLYDQIVAPTLLLRGAESDLLSRATARAMGERGPRATCVEFSGVGHAPTLVSEEQVATVVDFLLAA